MGKQIICSLLVLILASPLLAKPKPLPQIIVSLKVREEGVRSSLEQLLKTSGLTYQIESSVNDDRKISVDVRGAKWADVFRFILNDANLNYQFNRDGLLIISKAQ